MRVEGPVSEQLFSEQNVNNVNNVNTNMNIELIRANNKIHIHIRMPRI